MLTASLVGRLGAAPTQKSVNNSTVTECSLAVEQRHGRERFEIEEVELQLYQPDGRRFVTYAESEARASRERIRADRAETQAAIFASRLRELGVNPEELLARHRCAVPCRAVPCPERGGPRGRMKKGFRLREGTPRRERIGLEN